MRSPNDGVNLETPPAQTVTAVDDDGTNKARSTAAPACPDRLPGSGEGAGAVGGGLAGASFGRGATAIWQCTECIQQQIQYSAHSTSTRAQGPLRWNLQGCMVRSSFFRGVVWMIRLTRTN